MELWNVATDRNAENGKLDSQRENEHWLKSLRMSRSCYCVTLAVCFCLFNMVFGSRATFVCLYFLFFRTFVHAHGNREAVRACGVILRDLPEALASSFCSSYVGIEDKMATCTSTKTRKTTVTSNVNCHPEKTPSAG